MTAAEGAAGPAPKSAQRPNNLVGAAILALFLALGGALAANLGAAPLTFAFVMSGWILAVMAHEFAHALVAYLGGDHSVRRSGYLAFDPRRYGDLATSLVIPLLVLAFGGIGFPGGAVYLRPDLMRGRLWRSASALAGPAATLLVLLLLAFLIRVAIGFGAPPVLIAALAFLAFLQATALILNLLPVPGLDGFNAIRPWLPGRWSPALRRLEGIALWVLLGVLLLVPGGGAALFSAAADVAAALAVPAAAVRLGFEAFRFWS